MKNIKELLSRLVMWCRLEAAIVEELERLEHRIYNLEENRKLKDASIVEMKKDLGDIKMVLRQKVSV